MKYAALIVAALTLTACATAAPLPPGVSASDVALYKRAVASAGCVIEKDAQAAPVEQQTGFDEDKLRVITNYLIDNAEVDVTTFGIRLTTGACA